MRVRKRNAKEKKDEGTKKERIEIRGKESDKKSPNYYPSLRIFFFPYSGSHPCPSLHSERSNPLHYRRLFLSIELATKMLVNAFLSCLFLLSCMLNEQKNTFADHAIRHGCVVCI